MSLLNKTNIRKYLLHEAKIQKPHREFTQVSQEAYEDIEARLRQICKSYVSAQRIGKTIGRP